MPSIKLLVLIESRIQGATMAGHEGLIARFPAVTGAQPTVTAQPAVTRSDLGFGAQCLELLPSGSSREQCAVNPDGSLPANPDANKGESVTIRRELVTVLKPEAGSLKVT